MMLLNWFPFLTEILLLFHLLYRPEEELHLVTGAETSRDMNSTVMRSQNMPQFSRDSTVRDRAMRDVYFEKR